MVAIVFIAGAIMSKIIHGKRGIRKREMEQIESRYFVNITSKSFSNTAQACFRRG
jgi:hypothetical protein